MTIETSQETLPASLKRKKRIQSIHIYDGLERDLRHTLAVAGRSMTFGQLRTALQQLLDSEHQWGRFADHIAVGSRLSAFLGRFPEVLKVDRIGTSWFAQLC